MRKLYPAIFLLFSGTSLFAQDIHFSQFFLTPLLTSPSNTGNFDGDWRFSANYRSQWSEIDKPYLTQAAGFEKQFYLHTEQITGGLQIVNDRSGGTLQVLKIMGSGGYRKRIGIHTLHGGLQLGYVRKSIDPNAETFPNQFNWLTGAFDPTLPNQEVNLTDRLSYIDLNAGAGYSVKLRKAEPYFHLGFFHLTTPRETFTGYNNILKIRTVTEAGVRWDISERVMLEPSLFWMGTTKASDMIAGSRLHYKLESTAFRQSSVFGGVYYRHGFSRNVDALFVTAGLRFKNYQVGISYDINVSQLQVATNNKGAFEIGFIYTAPRTRLRKTIVPCDRY